jgi:hypothetical protein
VWSPKLRNTELKMRSRGTGCHQSSLEPSAFNTKAAAEDEKLEGRIHGEEKQILDKCNKIHWLEKNQTAEEEESGHEQKELENICPHHCPAEPECEGRTGGDLGLPWWGVPPSGCFLQDHVKEAD